MEHQEEYLDAVKIDPEHYSVAFENEHVRVLRISMGPHEKSVMHSHPPGVVVSLTDSHGTDTVADGSVHEFRLSAGWVGWDAAMTHLPENSSDERMELIYVEMKR